MDICSVMQKKALQLPLPPSPGYKREGEKTATSRESFKEPRAPGESYVGCSKKVTFRKSVIVTVKWILLATNSEFG